MIGGVFLSLGKAQKLAMTATTAVTQTAMTSAKVAVWSTVDCYIAFGGSTQTATTSSIPIPAGTWLFLALPAAYIAGICDTGNSGTLNIIECN